jgi:hypothetical protein
MCYLALTYDHRLVDGADAARSLSEVKQRLEAGVLGRSGAFRTMKAHCLTADMCAVGRCPVAGLEHTCCVGYAEDIEHVAGRHPGGGHLKPSPSQTPLPRPGCAAASCAAAATSRSCHEEEL